MINIDSDEKLNENNENILKSNPYTISDNSKFSYDENFDTNERLNTDLINTNQIQNLYNYIIKLREKNKILMTKFSDAEQIKNEKDNMNRILNEKEEYIKILQFDHNKLIKRTEDYQMQLAEWEKHLQEITYKLAKLEEENKCLFEDNKLLKAKANELVNQVKILRDNESSYESSFKALKKEKLEKINVIESKVNYQVKQLDFEYKQKLDQFSTQLLEKEKKIDKLSKDNKVLIDQFAESDIFFKNKEIEFEKLTNLKDEKLRELEECLSFISKETDSQNQKIKQNLNDQYLKEEQLKKYIFQLENKIEIIKKKLNEKDKIIKFLEQKINVLIPPNVYTGEYKVTNY